MLLIVYYLIFMIAGDLAAYFIGLSVEYEWGSQVSLIVFLALFGTIAQRLNLKHEFHHTASKQCILGFEPLK
jgi:hypothetical protein